MREAVAKAAEARDITAIRGGSLPRTAKPRPTRDRAIDSHNHVEVVVALKWRGDLRHAARGARGVRIGPTGVSKLRNHDRIADRAAHRTARGEAPFPRPRRYIGAETVLKCSRAEQLLMD